MKGIHHIYEGQHKSEYRAQFNKNDAYYVHHATKNKWRTAQATINAQWCSIVYQWIWYRFIAFTWTIWRFLRAYAGLLVDGFDDSGVCLSIGLNQKTVWLACAFQAHWHALPSNLDLRAFWHSWGLWLWRQWLPHFFGLKGTTRKAEKI